MLAALEMALSLYKIPDLLGLVEQDLVFSEIPTPQISGRTN